MGRSLTKGYLQADREILKPSMFGLGPRGQGGPKCGATCAAMTIFEHDGDQFLAVHNVGDSRVYLHRGGDLIQVTYDHVPDTEEERLRIESFNTLVRAAQAAGSTDDVTCIIVR